MINLSKKLEGGATYRVSFTAYSEVSSLNFNEQVVPIEGGDQSYAYMPTRITETRWKTTKASGKISTTKSLCRMTCTSMDSISRVMMVQPVICMLIT